jgi:DNA-binding CsgD family transcriptional regulator
MPGGAEYDEGMMSPPRCAVEHKVPAPPAFAGDMLDSPPTAQRSGRRAAPHEDRQRFTPRLRPEAQALDQARAAALVSRDARERLWAGALETLVAFIPAAVAVAFTVDAARRRTPEMAYVSAGARADVDALVLRMARLEPIDPFSVLRAEAAGQRVRSIAEAGGQEGLGRTLYGRHLARHGLRTPLFAYFWDERRIVGGVALVRTADGPDFDARAVRLLEQLHPLLEDALTAPIAVSAADPVQLAECRLTERERDIVDLVLSGGRNADIAATLGVSEATVKTHLTRVYQKAGVRSRTELTALAAAN